VRHRLALKATVAFSVLACVQFTAIASAEWTYAYWFGTTSQSNCTWDYVNGSPGPKEYYCQTAGSAHRDENRGTANHSVSMDLRYYYTNGGLAGYTTGNGANVCLCVPISYALN
jgi:hypothetical protein